MDATWTAGSFVAGTFIGSFLNVCIFRWPDGFSVISPPSRCLKCERPIGLMENVPVVSWIALRGRCRGCGARISFQYPTVEIIGGAIWMLSYLQYGASFTGLRVAVLISILLGVTVTDARRYLIPDGFTVFGFVWVIVTAFAALFIGEAGPFAGAYGAVIGACAGAGAIAIAGWLGEVALKREAMGMGDMTLMAMIGAAVGPERALVTIFLGALLGTVIFLGAVFPVAWMRAKMKNAEFAPPPIPFGVFLAPAAVFALLWGDRMISTYTRISGL